MFEPVKNQRVSDEILQQIRDAVLTGKFQIGDRLPNERTLAEQFAASRTSVREALRGLEQQGVIYTKKGVTGGAFVADLDHRLVSRSFQTLLTLRKISINHIAEVRLIFEPEAARLAALRATAQDLAEMEEVIETMNNAVEAGKSPGSFDLKFHKLVARAADRSGIPPGRRRDIPYLRPHSYCSATSAVTTATRKTAATIQAPRPLPNQRARPTAAPISVVVMAGIVSV